MHPKERRSHPIARHVSMSESRPDAEGVIRVVRDCGEPVLVTRYGKPVAVLMSAELYARYIDAAERLHAIGQRLVEEQEAEKPGGK